jgi:hypothetical protein
MSNRSSTGPLRPNDRPHRESTRPSGRCGSWPLRGVGGRHRVAGLWVTPPDKVQGNLVRLVYVHPPIAWVALYLAFGRPPCPVCLWLWPRTRSVFWDRLAAAAVEVGVFTASRW